MRDITTRKVQQQQLEHIAHSDAWITNRLLLAERMRQALREGDTRARLGGDEFVAVLLDMSGIVASEPILTRLLSAAAQMVSMGDVLLQVSASLGVTSAQKNEEVDADQLLRQVDQAIYQAKQSGKNRCHVLTPDKTSVCAVAWQPDVGWRSSSWSGLGRVRATAHNRAKLFVSFCKRAKRGWRRTH